MTERHATTYRQTIKPTCLLEESIRDYRRTFKIRVTSRYDVENIEKLKPAKKPMTKHTQKWPHMTKHLITGMVIFFNCSNYLVNKKTAVVATKLKFLKCIGTYLPNLRRSLVQIFPNSRRPENYLSDSMMSDII